MILKKKIIDYINQYKAQYSKERQSSLLSSGNDPTKVDDLLKQYF